MVEKAKKSGLKEAPLADYMKIRQYVVSLSERGGTEPVLIPSMNELARDFGVTRMTVHKALKELIKDKHLIVRKGIGTYINPAGSSYKKNRCIGIIVGNGRHCFYDSFYWEMIAELGKAVAAKRLNVKIINLLSSTAEELASEVHANWIDGLIWITPNTGVCCDAIKILHDEKYPVVAMHADIEGVNTISVELENHAYEITKKLIGEGRRNIVFAALNGALSSEKQLKGFRKAFEEASLKLNEKLIISESSELQKDFETILDYGIKVDAVYIVNPYTREILESLKKYGIDTGTECRIIAEPFYIDEFPSFRGIVREYPFKEEGELAASILQSMMEKEDFSAKEHLFDFKLKILN